MRYNRGNVSAQVNANRGRSVEERRMAAEEAVRKAEEERKRKEAEAKAQADAEAAKRAAEQAANTQPKPAGTPSAQPAQKGTSVMNFKPTKEQKHEIQTNVAWHRTDEKLVKAAELDLLPPEMEDQRKELEEKNKAGKLSRVLLEKYSSQDNQYAVDATKFGNVKELAYFCAGLSNDKDRVTLYNRYADKKGLDVQDLYYQAETMLGGKAFDYPQSARGRMEMIGVYDYDGNELDLSNPTQAQVIQAIRMTPPGDDHDILVKAYRTMFGDWETTDEDLAFRDSADLTASDYKSAVESFNVAFSHSDGHTEANQKAYDDALAKIYRTYKNPRVQKQMIRQLDLAYEDKTGKHPLDKDEFAGKDAVADALSETEDVKHYIPEVYEVTESAAAGQGHVDRQTNAPASSYAAAGQVVMPKESQTEKSAEEVAAVSQAADNSIEPIGPEYRPQEQAKEMTPADTMSQYGSSMGFNRQMTDEEALALYKRGVKLDERNYDQIRWMVEDNDIRALTGNMSMYANMGKTEEGGRNVVEKATKYGNRLGTASMVLGSGSLPEDIENEAALALGNVIYQIKGLVADPKNGISVPKGQNMYDYVLSLPQYEHLAAQVDTVTGAQADVHAAYAQQAQLEKEAQDKHIEDVKAKMLRGEGTPEMAQELAQAYGTEYVDLWDDELYAVYRTQMGERHRFFSDSGTFWQGSSAAAQEGNRLRGVGRGYGEFKSSLKAETENLLDDFGTAAKQMGMTLEEYLNAAGIDSLDQVVNIAYNGMLSRGNAYASDADAQAAAETMISTEKGAWDAAGMGIQHGAESYVADMSQTLYMAVDAADYQLAVIDLENEYIEKYGVELAAAMYRADLMAYIESGAMSEESAADLVAHMSRARSIFDVGYELDPGFLEGLMRDTYEGFQKDVEMLEAEAAKLPPSLRMAFNAFSGASYSLAGMSMATLTGGLTGSAAVGSALSWGLVEYPNAYEANLAKGMSPGMAGFAAFGNAAIATAVNMGGTGTDMDIWFKGSAYQDFAKAMKGRKGMSLMKGLAEATAKYVVKRGVEESVEEGQEYVLGALYDLTDNAMLLIDSGKPVTTSAILKSVGDSVRETDYDAMGRELLQNMGMGFVMGGIFSLGGSVKTAFGAKKGLNMQRQYASIDLATQMAQGDVPFTEENIGKVYAAAQKDLLDARFRKYIDSNSMAALEQKSMLVAGMMGTAEAERKNAVDEAQRAQEYSAKAEAAREASKKAQARWWELRDRLASGDMSVEVELESARMQWHKAETALQEAENAAGKSMEKAQTSLKSWVQQCRGQAASVKSWMIQEQADQIASLRQRAAEALAEQYAKVEAQQAEAQKWLDAGRTSYDFSSEEYADYYDESNGAAENDGEANSIDADKILIESELITESKNAGLATEDELSTLKENEDALLQHLIGILDNAKMVRDELGDLDAYNMMVKQYNELLEKFRTVFDAGKLVPEMKMAEIPDSPARDESAKETAKAEARAAQEAKDAKEIEMIERGVFGDAEADTEANAGEATDTDALMSQIADVQSRIDEARSMGADADTIAALENELEPLNAQKQKAIEAETREFDMLYDMQMAAAETDADDDYYQSLNDAYMASADRLEAMGADVDSIIARQSGKAKAAPVQEARQSEAETAKSEGETEAKKPRKIIPNKGKKETAAQKRQRELTESIRRRREATDAKLANYKGAGNYIAKTPIYVNKSQEAEILRETGSKNLTELNGRFRARLTNKKSRTDAIPLDSGVLDGINAESSGVVDVASANPEMELANAMNAIQKLRDDRKQEFAEARELDRKKKEADARRREKIKAEEAKKKAEQAPATEAAPSSVDALVSPANTNTDAVVSAEVDAVSTQSTPAQTAQKLSKKGKKLESNALQAVQNLADTVGIGFRVKSDSRFQSADARVGSGVAGYYKNGQRNAIVRSKEAGRIEVSGHEIGHAIQEQLGIHSTQTMIDSWQKHFPNTGAYNPSQYDHEAFAEFFWRYLKGRDVAAAYADEASVDAFEYAMRKNKKLFKAVQKAQTQVSNYFNADTGAMIQANISSMADANKETPFYKKAMGAIVDDTAAAEQMQDVIRQRIGEGHLPYDLNLRDTIRYNRRASARAAQCIAEAMVDNDGNVVGESLTDVFREIEGKDYDLYMQWWLARHSLDRDSRKTEEKKNAAKAAGEDPDKVKPVVDQVFAESDISTEDRTKFIADTELAHPEFARTNERFQKWRRLFLETYLVNNGLMGEPARAEALLDMLDTVYPYYAPTKRTGKGGVATKIVRGVTGQKTYAMHEATGSTETIIDPFESFVGMVNSVVSLAAENDNRKKFAQLYDAFSGADPGNPGAGMGLFANEITQDMQKNTVDVKKMREKIEKMLDDAGTDPDVIMQISDLIGDEKVEYHGKGRVDMNSVIRVRGEDGKDRYFEIYNPQLFELLATVSGQAGKNESGLLKMVSNATRAMSMLTTGSNPVFGITNALRDFQNSVNYGSWATSYIDGAAKWLLTLGDVITNSDVSKEYDALGGGGWSQYDTRTKKGAEATRSTVFKGYNRRNVGQIGKMIGRTLWRVATMEDLNGAIEKASRLAEYKYGKHNLSTAEGRIEAFLAAQDVTTDFARHGNSQLARDLKYLIPFFNASMQGIYRNARQFTAQESDRAKIRLAKQITNTALASLLANGLLMMYLDDDEKEEFTYLSQDLTTKHMFIPNFDPDTFGDAMLIRIPLDQNPLSYAINAAVSNMVWKGETGDEFLISMAALADVIKDNLNPVSSTILDPVLAVRSNKNWYGSNIVPTYLQTYDALNQYTEETPEAFVTSAKLLNAVTGKKVSPMMLQYMAEQYIGYIGQTVIPALPSEKNQDGFISGLFSALAATARKRITSDPLKSNDVVSTVYDSFDEMNAVSKAGKSNRDFDIDYLKPTLTERERDRAIAEAYALTHSKGELYEAKKEISALYDEIDEINARDDLTDRQKYLLTSDVRREMIEIALDAQEVMQDYDARYRYDDILPRMFTEMLNK